MSIELRQRPPRLRGTYIPIAEVEAHLLFGWRILDEHPNCDEVLMIAPAEMPAPAAPDPFYLREVA